MTPSATCRAVLLAVALPFALALTSCSEAVQPQTTVRCEPGSIRIEVTNVSDEAARYTVSVAIQTAGTTFNQQYSSDTVQPGATGTITDSRPDERETCTVTKVEVFS